MFTHLFLNLCIMLKSTFFLLDFYYNRREMHIPLSPGHSSLSYIMQYKVIAQNSILSFMEFFQFFNCSANILVSLNCSFLYLLTQSQALEKICYNQLHFHFLYHKKTHLDSLSRTYATSS